MGSIRPNPTHVSWVRLGWVELDICDGLGWVEFFFTHHSGLDQKIPLTQPDSCTPLQGIYRSLFYKLFWVYLFHAFQ